MQLGQKGFEIYPTVKRGHALRRFVTPLTLRCVKSCPAPAPPQSLRNTAAMNQLLVGCSDLPSPIFFSMKPPDASREAVRCPQKNYLFRGKLDQDIPSMARAAAGALGFLTLIFLLET